MLLSSFLHSGGHLISLQLEQVFARSFRSFRRLQLESQCSTCVLWVWTGTIILLLFILTLTDLFPLSGSYWPLSYRKPWQTVPITWSCNLSKPNSISVFYCPHGRLKKSSSGCNTHFQSKTGPSASFSSQVCLQSISIIQTERLGKVFMDPHPAKGTLHL